MDNMKIVLALDNYSIYYYDKYYLCFPNNASKYYHLFIGFSLVDLTTLSEEDLYKEIRKIGDSLNHAYVNAIYVLPIIDPKILCDAANENDDHLYNKLLKKYIQPITLEIHNNFLTQKKHVSQIVKFIKKNDVDTKIVGWISMKLGNDYVREITFDENVTNKNITEQAINNNITVDYKDDEIWIKKQEETIDDTLKASFSFGFSSLGFMLMTITISLVLCVFITYMIIK